jgi:8-amino-7-oxononanoate synthase
MSSGGFSDISERLAELERLGLGRRLRMISGPQGPRVLLDGKPVLLMCSNNYLGLADHPRVREAAAEAAMRWGVGAGASRLVSGTMTIHRRLEDRLAAFKRSEGAILFGSGYLANLGVIGALVGRDGVVFSDELNHASIVDGCRLSGARIAIYRHRDAEHLDWCLRRHGSDERLIVTDSVFSMDGDVAPLEDIVELAQMHRARVVVDEAHATGNLGPGGRGAVADAGLESEVDVVVGTLGKALGSYGAYACASAEMVRYLVNAARSLIFSTAPGPPAIAGALAALEFIEERPHRVGRLRANARALRVALAEEGFPVAECDMHIVPLVVGEERDAMSLCQRAIERGVFAQAIRPPTVPAGTSRLRLTTMASHTRTELAKAAKVFSSAARELGLDLSTMGPAVAEPPRLRELELAEASSESYVERVEVPAAPRGDVPFDVERELRAVEDGGEATMRFDVEREVASAAAHEGEGEAAPDQGERPSGSGPFDFERDARAA